ncbi:hypothetical protein [Caudoviricetes sp.]|nr:hypothetical protein [Caudoviricetes sp.]
MSAAEKAGRRPVGSTGRKDKVELIQPKMSRDNQITNEKIQRGELPETMRENVPQGTAVASPIQSPVPATAITPAPTISLPEPTALPLQTANVNSIQGDVDAAKAKLDTTITGQQTKIDTEIADLQKEQETILAQGKELTQPFREKLEKKERERLKINENFEANQKLVDELDSLLTEGNELINIATGRQVANKVLEKSLTKTMADVQARAGVVQAVMAARNGQITTAERFIDRTTAAIVADRNDQLSYYNTILELNNNKLVKLDAESVKLAEVARNQAEKEVEQAEATAAYVKSLMINPETAQFMADAGVSLSDGIDGIKTKMAKQAKTQEAIDTRNELIDAGYDISPVPVPGGIAIEAGGQTIYAKVRPGSELALRMEAQRANIAQSYASAAASTTSRLIDLATAGNPEAIKQLGLTMPNGNEPSTDQVAYAQEYAATGKIPTGIPKSISFGSIAALAKDLPKPVGTFVNRNTGVTDTTVGAAEQEDIKRLYNITKLVEKLETQDKERWSGVVPGVLGKIFGSSDQGSYLTTRKAIVDEIARMQTGAALTVDEQGFYNDYLPGRFAEPLGFGRDSSAQIADFKALMNEKLQNSLNNNSLSVYGYSKIPLGDEEYTVGEIITNEYGQRGIVQPDGNITLIQ